MSDDQASRREPSKRAAYEPVQRLLRPTGYNPSMPRPLATKAGVALLALRVLTGALVIAGGAALVVTADGLSDDERALGTVVFVGVGGAVLLLDAALAAFIWFGHNWARVLVMLVSVVSVSSLFLAWWDQGQEITLLPNGGLIPLGLDVLVLLALSSRDAAAYARRNERR